MNQNIQLFGLGFDQGQSRPGLRKSHQYLEKFFPALKSVGLDIQRVGTVENSQKFTPKIFSEDQLALMDWLPYQTAYQGILDRLHHEGLLLNWGGDHSVGISTVGAFCAKYPEGKVLWIDAHADLNKPEFSPSGHFHGMPVAILLNLHGLQETHFPWLQGRLKPENLIYLGLRDLDPFEQQMLVELGIHHYTMSDIRHLGIRRVAAEILRSTRNHSLHISFDIDSVSPEFAPATGVPVAEGFTLAELRQLGRDLSLHPGLKSLDVVEINPELGSSSQVTDTYIAAFHLMVPLMYQGRQHVGMGWVAPDLQNR
jgi:arginase